MISSLLSFPSAFWSGAKKLVKMSLWPIENETEKKLLISFATMMCCIIFCYNTSRAIKDVSVISTSAGAAVIPFIKLYLVTPAAFLYAFLIYPVLLRTSSLETIFRKIMMPFIAWFAFYPIMNTFPEFFHPSEGVVSFLLSATPISLHGFIHMFAIWPESINFMMAELLGTCSIPLAFWFQAILLVSDRPQKGGSIAQNKRFFGSFIAYSNLAAIFAGLIMQLNFKFISGNENIPFNIDGWTLAVYLAYGSILISFLIMFYAQSYLWKVPLKELPDLYNKYSEEARQARIAKGDGGSLSAGNKSKPGFFESMKEIVKSPELFAIFILLISYGISINLIEIQWKNQIGIFFNKNRLLIGNFYSQYSTISSITVFAFSIFISSRFLQYTSWIVSALSTPVIGLISGSAFFVLVIFFDVVEYGAAIVWFGCAIISAIKSAKYCLFDTTNQLAIKYVAKRNEIVAAKGKAVLDVPATRMSKSGGSIIHQVLMSATGVTNVFLIVQYTSVIFIFVMLMWIAGVIYLARCLRKTDEEEALMVSAKASKK